MASNADALKERYQRFSQGDLDGALDLWTDDFIWEGSNSPEPPGSGRHEGKQAAIEVLQRAVGAWDTFELTADEPVEQGDTIVVLGHTHIAKDDERSARRPSSTFRACVATAKSVACRSFTDTLESARVLGIV